MRSIENIYRLGVKELWSLLRDPIMLALIVFTFTASIYSAATAQPDTLHMAPIAFVDEDGSPLSARIISAFFPPQFGVPVLISADQVDHGLDSGQYTFSLSIPPDFQRDVLAGRHAELQLNVDATRMSQAFTGSGYIQQIAGDEIRDFVQRYRGGATASIDLEPHMRFNPNLEQAWFGSLMEIINNVTMLSIILTGAALIREREHGTIEHLLVMPVTPAEIMLAKVWANGLVILVAVAASLLLVVRTVLQVPIAGSPWLFLLGVVLYLFFATALGIFLGTITRSMAQFALLIILIVIVLQLLSGGNTPVESQPLWMQRITFFLPSRHFVSFSQAIIYRGAGLRAVWPNFLAVGAIGLGFFVFSLRRFRQSIAVTK